MSIQLDKATLLEYLRSPELALSPIVATDGKSVVLDLSVGSRLRGQEINNLGVAEFSRLIDEVMQAADTAFAFGRYAEPRELYNNENFDSDESDESRTIHMGLDLFCAADTPVYAPLGGTVELLHNNASELDYGPMLVLRHATDTRQVFYTLYGHLSLDTLTAIKRGQEVSAGEQIATVGSAPHNGNWPPHLHLQLILDLLDLDADFPGVACKSKQDHWLTLSPSPAVFFPQHDVKSLEYPPCN
jgi:murein DD-endopeptidase MepM/ murein hydrolase activator NlpD